MSGILVTAAKNQWRALVSLVVTEFMVRSSRRSLGMVEEIGGLALFVVGFVAFRLLAKGNSHHGMPVLPFVLSGLVLFRLFLTTSLKLMSLASLRGQYKNNPRVTTLDIVLARAFYDFLIYTFIAFSAFIILYSIGMSPWMQHPWIVLALFILASIWGVGIGICLGTLQYYIPVLRIIMAPMMMLLMWLSGIFFIWPEVPYSFRWLMDGNPIFHMIELMRDAYFQSYVSAVASWPYFLSWVFLSLILGLTFERVLRKVAQNTKRNNQEGEAFGSASMM